LKLEYKLKSFQCKQAKGFDYGPRSKLSSGFGFLWKLSLFMAGKATPF